MYRVNYRVGYGQPWHVVEGTYTISAANKKALALIEAGYKATIFYVAEWKL